MNYANEIKSAVTMRQVCELYGIDVNRQGFARCPFHNEKTPSMKVYAGDRGFNCFGCNTHGSVIDFVMMYFNLNFAEAQKKLNDDFFLRLPIGEKPTLKEYRKAQHAQEERKRQIETDKAEHEKLLAEYDAALERYAKLDRQLSENRPTDPSKPPSPLFFEAVNEIGYAEYLLDLAQTRLNDYENKRK